VLLRAVLLRRLTAAPIDRYLRPAGPTAANPPQRLAAANGKTDGHTNGHRTRCWKSNPLISVAERQLGVAETGGTYRFRHLATPC